MKIALALDNFRTSSKNAIESFVQRCLPYIDTVKIGLELYIRFGPEIIKLANGKEVFLDLKLHDTPHTISNAAFEVDRHGADYLTVHGNADPEMLKAASKSVKKTKILAVTILTSSSKNSQSADLNEIIFNCAQAGISGFISPVGLVKQIKNNIPGAFVATPGIRIDAMSFLNDDQKHISSPEDAFSAGSDMIVVGRAVTISSDPIKVLQKLQKYRHGKT